MKLALSVCLLCSFCLAAKAQATGDMYAAPGMSVKLQRGVPVSPTRLKARPKSGTAASKAPSSPVLSRFWHQADTAVAKYRLYQLFHQTASRQLKYPQNSLRAGLEGKIYVRLTILADGSVGQAIVTRRELASWHKEEDKKLSDLGKADLDAEVLRVMRSVHFEPSKMASDTVTIASGFAIQ